MSEFTKIVGFKPLPDGKNWVLLEDLVYYADYTKDATGAVVKSGGIVVPAGFVTDFASVPKPFQCFVGRWGRHGNAAVVHDWVYRTKPMPRRAADKIFLEAMEVLGVGRVTRYAIYAAVRLFGWVAWRRGVAEILDLDMFKRKKVTEIW